MVYCCNCSEIHVGCGCLRLDNLLGMWTLSTVARLSDVQWIYSCVCAHNTINSSLYRNSVTGKGKDRTFVKCITAEALRYWSHSFYPANTVYPPFGKKLASIAVHGAERLQGNWLEAVLAFQCAVFGTLAGGSHVGHGTSRTVCIHQTAPPLASGSSHLITAYYSFIDPKRMKDWVGLVSWPTVDGLPI